MKRPLGFTLVELMIVVATLAILAALVMPTFSNAQDHARIQATATNMRTLFLTAERYRFDQGGWPPDYWIGMMPAEFEGYLVGFNYNQEAPIGGLWDFDNWSYGPLASSSGRDVRISTSLVGARSEAYAQAVDQVLDDGDLSTGTIQQIPHSPMFFVLGYVHEFAD